MPDLTDFPAPTNEWRLRCRLLAAALILTTAVVNLAYFHINCPIDLSGDEAQYWDWSRRLDLSYYSKGPAIAYIIRAGTAVFGDTMPGVRTPAVILFVLTLLGIYATASHLAKDERVALLAIVLCSCSPIMIYLSGAMTIDAPMIACWTWGTWFAARAMFPARSDLLLPMSDARSVRRVSLMWIGVGVLLGIGFLSKYSALLWFVGLALFLIWDRRPRRDWISAGIALAISAVFTIPVIVWNARNGWVGARHVARQTGAEGGRFNPGNIAEMIGGQIGVVGPTIALIMAAALVWAVRGHAVATGDDASNLAKQRALNSQARFLIAIGTPFWLLTFFVSFVAKVQVNWPAPAYITLFIVAAMFIVDRTSSALTWQRWRWIVAATAVIGLGAQVLMRDPSILIPPLKLVGVPEKLAAKVDGLARLRGWEELGAFVGEEQQRLGEGAFILCDHYQQTAAMAFYVPGRPRTFHAGTYFTKPQRMNQYSLWPDMRLDQPVLLGKNAVYVAKDGPMPKPLPAAFDRVEKLPEIPVIVRGVQVATFRVWRCYGFKGLSPPAQVTKH